MRELTAHKVNECNEAITVTADDEPGPGGANHLYCLSWSETKGGEVVGGQDVYLRFQNGAIKEVGTNGLTHEALLAVVIDRLQSFQAGPYRCPENADALMHLNDAMEALHRRTRAREARGVEGTMAL